jgi:Tfp pilus assembly protein FimV
MELGNLPQDIAMEIEKNPAIPQIVQLAERILNQGDSENASKILDLVLEA